MLPHPPLQISNSFQVNIYRYLLGNKQSVLPVINDGLFHFFVFILWNVKKTSEETVHDHFVFILFTDTNVKRLAHDDIVNGD